MKKVILPSILNLFSLPKYMTITNDGNENNILLLPYKLARKVSGKKNYLVFYVWNEVTQKLQRIRREPPVSQKENVWFRERIIKLNEMLVNGYRIVSDAKLKEIEFNCKDYTILEALDAITQIRIKNKIVGENSQDRQKSFRNIFETYLVSNGLQNFNVSQIKRIHIITFIDSIVGKAITKNNYLSYIKAIFASFLDKEWITENPTLTIKNLKEEESTSIAFDTADLPKLKNLLIEHSSELYIFCMFIFYSFIRPIELRRLSVSDVDLVRKRILVKGNSSKNKKSNYVLISKQFAEILENYKFLERPKTEPLFSLKNNMKYSKNYFSTEFKKIIRKNGFNDDYAIYGWKHTGVSEHYKITKDIKFIQMQCRHSSLDETNKYLKGLGLFEDNANLDNAPTI